MNAAYLYGDDFEVSFLREFYSKLSKKQIVLLAPFLFNLVKKTSESHSLYNDIILKRDLRNIISNHFEVYWSNKLEKVFAVELFLLARLAETNSSDNEMVIREFSNKDYRVSFAKRYPLLMNFADIYCRNYQAFIFGLLDRLQIDLVEIKNQFLGSQTSCSVKNIELAGDPHGNASRVSIITFSVNNKEIKLIYKPREGINEILFYKVTAIFSGIMKIKFFSPKLIIKDKYLWIEFVKNEPCKNCDQIRNYYYRFGILAYITLLLNARDIHFENIIAHGKYPCIVDCECFFSPKIEFVNKSKSILLPTVYDSLMFPYVYDGKDQSALTGLQLYTEINESEYPKILKKFYNFKDHKKNNAPKIKQTSNKPKLIKNNLTVDAYSFLDDIINGFKHAYSTYQVNKKILFLEIRNLLSLSKHRTRIIIRPTSYYQKFLLEMFHPKLLGSEKEFKKFMENLKTDCYDDSFYRSETRQLLNLDIPIFFASNGKKSIVDDKNNSISISKFTSFPDLFNKLFHDGLSNSFLESQVELIKQSLEIRKLNFYEKNLKTQIQIKRKNKNSAGNLNVEEKFNCIVKSILDNIISRSVKHSGFICWSNPYTILQKKQKKNDIIYTTGFTDNSLYNGNCGIMLTMYYAYKLYDIPRYRQCVNDILQSLKLSLSSFEISSLGAYCGLGQYLYLVSILQNDFPKEVKFLKEFILNHLDSNIDRLIKDDDKLDIIYGTAGLAVVVCKSINILSKTKKKAVLNICIKHICQYINTHLEVKQNKDIPIFHAGLSHGVSGLLWCLIMLEKYLPLASSELTDVINKLFFIERSFYNPKKFNWTSFSNNSSKHKDAEYVSHWCHGAIGILLSKADIFLMGYRDPYIEQELILAANCLTNYSLPSYVNLCHGNLAIFDLLTKISKCGFNVDEKLEQYKKILSTVLDNNFLTNCNNPLVFEPGLMTGQAGIAYQLMRINNQKYVPSILLLDHLEQYT